MFWPLLISLNLHCASLLHALLCSKHTKRHAVFSFSSWISAINKCRGIELFLRRYCKVELLFRGET